MDRISVAISAAIRPSQPARALHPISYDSAIALGSAIAAGSGLAAVDATTRGRLAGDPRSHRQSEEAYGGWPSKRKVAELVRRTSPSSHKRGGGRCG